MFLVIPKWLWFLFSRFVSAKLLGRFCEAIISNKGLAQSWLCGFGYCISSFLPCRWDAKNHWNLSLISGNMTSSMRSSWMSSILLLLMLSMLSMSPSSRWCCDSMALPLLSWNVPIPPFPPSCWASWFSYLSRSLFSVLCPGPLDEWLDTWRPWGLSLLKTLVALRPWVLSWVTHPFGD